MSIFPNFSNVVDWVRDEFNRRKDNPVYVSGLNSWIRASSGVGRGLILQSNTDLNLLKAAGDDSGAIYGGLGQSGALGKNWNGGVVEAVGDTVGLRPSPVITSFEVDEGQDNISRKATLSITTFTKYQAEEISKYFLEPGFSIFVEWGWNKADAFNTFSPTLNVEDIIQYQDFKYLNSQREKTKGNYDVFLGFITGGTITQSGANWEVSVECTGYPELPSYLMVSDSSISDEDDGDDGGISEYYESDAIESTADLGFKRFKMMFNELPSNKRTPKLKEQLEKIPSLRNVVNYVNFDEKVKDDINSATDGWFFGLGEGTIEESGSKIKIPAGTKIIGDEKFIKFDALMEIIFAIGAVSYSLGQTKTIPFKIKTDKTVISAFPRIFSTDKTKLFIPNPNTPLFSLRDASIGNNPDNSNGTFNNTVQAGENEVYFPHLSPIVNNQIIVGNGEGGRIAYVDEKAKTIPINKNSLEWGFLNDLYVNFDFVKGILETKNLLIKDALYQILNGLSSAAGSVWDFQIIELPTADENGNLQLTVIDKNFVYDEQSPFDGILELDVINENSILIDNSFDIQMSSNMMNQIIGKRLGTSVNSSSPSIGKIFAIDLEDKILNEINTNVEELRTQTESGASNQQNTNEVELENVIDRLDELYDGPEIGRRRISPTRIEYYKDGKLVSVFDSIRGSVNPEIYQEINTLERRKRFLQKQLGQDPAKIQKEKEEQREKIFKNAIDDIGIYPKVNIIEDSAEVKDKDIYSSCYIGILNELGAFERAKILSERENANKKNSISVLMPVTFSFTVHGVSGIKRGDKFRINGLPHRYSTNGFFQVTAVKHTIDGATWKTQITGGFRTVNLE